MKKLFAAVAFGCFTLTSAWAVEPDAEVAAPTEWVFIKGKVVLENREPFYGLFGLEIKGSVIALSSGVSKAEADNMAASGFGASMNEKMKVPSCKGDILVKVDAQPGNFMPTPNGEEYYAVPKVLEFHCEEAKGFDLWEMTGASELVNAAFIEKQFSMVEQTEGVSCRMASGKRHFNSMSQNPFTGSHFIAYGCLASSPSAAGTYKAVEVRFSFDYWRRVSVEVASKEISAKEYQNYRK